MIFNRAKSIFLILQFLFCVGCNAHTDLAAWKAGSAVSQSAVEAYGAENCFRSEPISDAVFSRMQDKSFRHDCTVPREALRYIRVLHYDNNGTIRLGELVANWLIADDLVAIFRELYENRYPIERMVLIDDYNADDESSMRANNSSCFCFRTIAGSKKLSNHALGLAVDINTLYNPYVKRRRDGSSFIQPETAAAYVDRTKAFPYKIAESDLCCRLFLAHGFDWGGSWSELKDYQHFEKTFPAEWAMQSPRVILGDEQAASYLPLLQGKRVALFTNQSGIVGDKITLSDGTVAYGGNRVYGTAAAADTASFYDGSSIPFGRDGAGNAVSYGEHILDALLAQGVAVTAVFSPEHGFRGTADAGAGIKSSVDEKTGVPILSLYEDARTHAPSKESLSRFDVLVVDIQDVGLRYYTYYLSLYHLMNACAAHNKAVVILDRPNPNGFYVDGALLRPEYHSGVGLLPLPTVYGLTLGELALLINGEGYLAAGKNACALSVIPCLGYTHQTKYALVRAPSPNLKDMRAVYLYASTCFFENTLVSVGRGTAFPFVVFGSPELYGSAAFSFTPQSMPGAAHPPFEGIPCGGVDLRTKPIVDIWREGIQTAYLSDMYRAIAEKNAQLAAERFFGTPDAKGRYWLDLLSGSDALRKQVSAGAAPDGIKASWQADIAQFKRIRAPYLLYKE